MVVLNSMYIAMLCGISRHAIREYNIHKQLEHPRIIRLYDVFEINNNAYVLYIISFICNAQGYITHPD